MAGLPSALHLARRFFGSLSPTPLAADDRRWVHDQLLPGERMLFERMPRADQKHAAGVARTVVAGRPDVPRAAIAAALLHDVGKVESGFGTFGRVVATLITAALGHDRLSRWRGTGGWRGRLGSYATHDAVGARLLTEAGSDPLTVAWAREHHLPPERWTVPVDLGTDLRDADDD